MHHCLAIAEIQHLIFEIIREEDYPFLATLAHTCRAFKESALNSLWYELSGISPLFRCLPQEAWERETDPTYSWKRRPLTLKRGLTKSDIEIIRRYSWRIHIIHTGQLDVDVSGLQSLSIFPEPLFPNLRRLDWLSTHKEDFPYLRLFLGKKLTSVKILIEEWRPAQASLVNALPILLSPSILHRLQLDVSGNERLVGISPVTTNLSIWPALRNLYIPGATAEGLSQIGDLPNLQRLTLGNRIDQMTTEDQTGEPIAGSFTRLRTLTIMGLPTTITKLLPLFRNAKLEELTMKSLAAASYDNNEWRECMEAVDKNVDHYSLRTIHIEFPGIVAFPQFSDIFSPILGLAGLQKVKIHLMFNAFGLYDDDASKIAKSWPNITSLIFIPEDEDGTVCSKLSSLVPLAKGCLKLRRLGLCINALNSSDRSSLLHRLQTAEFDAPHSVLTCLDVGYSPISHKEFVATFLTRIFPNLVHIKSNRYDTEEVLFYHRRWQRIGQVLLPLLKITARRERNHSMTTERGDELGDGDNDFERLKFLWSREPNSFDEESDGGTTDEEYPDETEEESDDDD